MWLEQEPRCIFDPDEPLRLWLDVLDPAEVSVLVDGEPWIGEESYHEELEGFGLALFLPVESRTLEIEGATAEPWVLQVVSTERAPPGPAEGVRTSADIDEDLVAAYLQAAAGRYDEALQTLDRARPDAQRYPKGRADHATYLGIVLWWQGRFHDAAVSLRDGVVFAIALDDEQLQYDALSMYPAVLAELGYLEAAAEWSDRVLTLARDEPQIFDCSGLARLLSTLAWVDLSSSTIRGRTPSHARALLEEALTLVDTGGRCPTPASVPALMLSLALADLRDDDPAGALARLAEVRLADATIDQQLRLLDMEVSALLDRGETGSLVERSLQRLARAVDRAATPEGRWRLALRRGDLLVRQHRLEDAIAAYRDAEHYAHQITQLAAVGVGRETAASLHAESTERLVAVLVQQGQGHEAFCAAREAQARRTQAVDGGTDDPERRARLHQTSEHYASLRRALDDALSLAERSSRSDRDRLRHEVEIAEQALAELANQIVRDRSTWRPTCEDLGPRAPGELLLGLYAMSRDWFLFAEDDRGTTVRWLSGGPSRGLEGPALGQELLTPFHEQLTAAQRVKVVAGGLAQSVDVHLLEWQGARLVEHKPVVYGAELPYRPSAGGLRDEPHALIVTDPTQTLPMAGPEGLMMSIGLSWLGWTVDAPPPEEADRARIREGLAHASFFYYAGHAHHDVGAAEWGLLPPYAGGTDAWPAQLTLRPPATLEIQDILMLEAVPRHVALLGCETGVPAHMGGGMSLALAFLVAGAEEVVATPVETADEVALATGPRLLQGISTEGVSLAEGLQRAQAQLLGSGQAVGRYRVWVR